MDSSGNAYEPIEWTLTNGSTTILNGGSFDDLLDELDNIVAIDCPPNTNLSTIANFNYGISWEWPFEVDDDNDTFLGNQTPADLPTVTLSFVITVTQID